MFAWLFKKSVEVVDAKFSNLPVGRFFKKANSNDFATYIKVAPDKYQTEPNGWRCPKWFLVTEDFEVDAA